MTASPVLFAPDGALRAPWRITIFVVVSVLAWLVVGGALVPLVQRVPVLANAPDHGGTLIADVGVLIGTAVCVRLVDGRPWSAVWLGRRGLRPRAWVEGWLLGALAIGLPCLVLLATGQLGFGATAAGSWPAAALRVSIFLLPAALLEELLYRGYLFAVLGESLGWKRAVGVSAVAFGLLHIPNPDAGVEPILVVTLAGVFLAGIVLATGSLYAAWMAHFGWNWIMAVPLHSAVSGLPLATPDYRLVDAGPRWLTGGAWGPEGGLAAAAGILAGLTYLYARRPRREES